MARALALLLGLVTTGCSTPYVRFDPSRLEPFTYGADQRESLDAPYASIYSKRDRKIIFIAARHDVGGENPTARTIDAVLKGYRPGMVIVEGRPFTALSDPADLARAENCAFEQFKNCPEDRYAIFRAAKSGIPFAYAEPSPAQIRDRLRERGYDAHDLIFFYGLRQIPQWKRAGTIGEKALREKLTSALPAFARELETREALTLADFEALHRTRLGKPFRAEAVDTETVSPQMDQNPTWANQISHEVGRVREESLLRHMETAVNKYGILVVIYGQGHLVKQRSVLRQAMGEPRDEKFF